MGEVTKKGEIMESSVALSHRIQEIRAQIKTQNSHSDTRGDWEGKTGQVETLCRGLGELDHGS